MTQQTINRGTAAGDGTGESLFNAFTKVNANFTELYGFSATALYPGSIGVTVQGYSANLTSFAGITPTAAGLALLDDANAAAQRATLGLGTAATSNTGDFATSGHNHSGVYQPADADLTTWAGVTPGTGIATALAVAVGTDGAPVIKGGALGTPSAGMLSKCIGLPAAGVFGTALVYASIGSTVQAYDANTAKTNVANSWTAQQTFKEVKDTVYTITDGAAFEIDPGNGSIQTITLGASRTPAATNFEAGQIVLLGVDDGTAYAITWTTVAVTWVKGGGTASAPTLATTGYTWILLWKVGSTIYGCEVGKP